MARRPRPPFLHPIKHATWPAIPPWWTLASPAAAAILGRDADTLMIWRAKGLGPRPIPSAFIKATAGDPIYYFPGELRRWATGESYHAQRDSFLAETAPWLLDGTGEVETAFDAVLARALDLLRKGQEGGGLPVETVLRLGACRQPRWLADRDMILARFFDFAPDRERGQSPWA